MLCARETVAFSGVNAVPPPEKRVPKKLHATVNYRAGTTGQHCSICAMYISRQQSNGAPHCTAVVDPIQPKGMCDIFQKKPGKRSKA
jgi:hypothetical protein